MGHERDADAAAIRALLTHYSHLIDDLRLDALARLFCRDGEWVVGDLRFAGHEAIRDGFRQIEPDRPGMVKHLTFDPIIRFEGDRAFAWADAIALSVAPDGITLAAAGRYHDEFAMEDGSWRFQRRVFIYSGEDLPEGVRPSPDGPSD